MDNTTGVNRRADDTLLVGEGTRIAEVPAAEWRRRLADAPAATAHRFAFMTADHRRVRAAAVRALPQNDGRPLTVAQLSDAVSLDQAQVDRVLDDLQRHLFFLVRDSAGAVSWAFPVTTDRTPHHLSFSSGERLWGA